MLPIGVVGHELLAGLERRGLKLVKAYVALAARGAAIAYACCRGGGCEILMPRLATVLILNALPEYAAMLLEALAGEVRRYTARRGSDEYTVAQARTLGYTLVVVKRRTREGLEEILVHVMLHLGPDHIGG